MYVYNNFLNIYLMVSEFKHKLCKTNYVHHQKKAKKIQN